MTWTNRYATQCGTCWSKDLIQVAVIAPILSMTVQGRIKKKKKKSEEHKLHIAPSKLGICNIWRILFWWWLYSVPLDLSHKNPNQTCLIQKPTTKPWKGSAEWTGGLQLQQDSLSLPIFSHFRMCIYVWTAFSLASLWGGELCCWQVRDYILTVYNLKERSSYAFAPDLENFDGFTWVPCSFFGPATVSRGI